MNAASSVMGPPAGAAPTNRAGAPPAPATTNPGLFVRLVLTVLVVITYYAYRESLVSGLQLAWSRLTGIAMSPHGAAAWMVGAMLACFVVLWWKILARDKRFHAPLLITSILLMGDAAFGILESHSSAWLARITAGYVTTFSPTFLAILTTILADMFIGRFFYGKWPHLASAYVSGISAGILIKSPAAWPFILCGLLSITSKYVFRIGDRHLWNPTNMGVTLMLYLAPQHVASLSVQAGNEIWAVVVIWIMGGLILYQLGRLHIPLAFIAAFLPLSLLRTWYTGNPIGAELAPMTSPMFQLFIFFMITDPKSTTKTWRRQIVVAVLVAIMETVRRIAFRDVHSLYHSLFIVGPITNLIEIIYLRNSIPARPLESLKELSCSSDMRTDFVSPDPSAFSAAPPA